MQADHGRSWPPSGQKLRLPIVRDTSISSVVGEQTGNNGGASIIKMKGQQEFILFDIDPEQLKGKIVTGAQIHFRSSSPDRNPLARVGVSTVASEWEEGSSKRYRSQKGSACFNQAEYLTRDWAYTGSTVMDVVFGRGQTIWRFADCASPDKEGWQTCAVEPDVVSSRIAGLSHGFCAYDEVGSVWSTQKDVFQYTYFPDRYVFSRESKDSNPWMDVWVTGEDRTPPEPVTSIEATIENLPPGEAVVRWKTPVDHGGGKVQGFHVSCKKGGKDIPVPQYIVPMAGGPGQEVLMHIRDTPFEHSGTVYLTIRAVDSAGNVSVPFGEKIKISGNSRTIDIPKLKTTPFEPTDKLPIVGGVRVAVVDLLDKVDPRTGEMIPRSPWGYEGGNHLFSAKKKVVRLQAARNEHAAFQINLKGRAQDIRVHSIFNGNPALKPLIYEFGYVEFVPERTTSKAILPDPLVPVGEKISIPSRTGQVRIPDQQNHSLIWEIYIPQQEPAGEKHGKLTLRVGNEQLVIDIVLEVWDFVLPNKLSFIPEMNAYGTVSPDPKGYEYYRLAHEHRTCINRLPYNWEGRPSFAPRWDENLKNFDWREWDKTVGPLLSGRAFNNMPRAGEPVDVFYLPFNENWPIGVFRHYTPSYWADEAFSNAYQDDLAKAFRSLATHFRNMGWHEPIFQFYLNNKVFYRNRTPKSSAPWIFDEPANTQDFWALRWYGLLWHRAVDPVVRGDTKMRYRCDISQGQFSRNTLWGITDIEYIGGNDVQKTRMKHDEQVVWPHARFSEYGSANFIDEPNTVVPYWCMCAWARGAMGVLSWQSIGNHSSWKIADKNSLFYPDKNGPYPSVRLKAFRRGQQDIEYLTILGSENGLPHRALSEWLSAASDSRIHPDGGPSDPEGEISTRNFDSTTLWKIRTRLGEVLSRAAPVYKRSYVNWTSPPLDVQKLPKIGYVQVSPHQEAMKPACDTFLP